MQPGRADGDEGRVLLLPPTARDAEVSTAFLARAGIAAVACRGHRALADELGRGVGALVLTDLAFASPAMNEVSSALARQPSWSDVPIVVLAQHPGQDAGGVSRLRSMTNMTVIERPCAPASLTSAVLAALRARWRQYEIRDQIETMRRAEEVLRTEDQRKDEFLAILSHELRNPLAPLTNALRLLAASDALTGRDRAMLEIAERQRRQLSRLIDDLLEVSRITRGRIELRLEIVDAGTAVRHAVDSIRPEAQARGHALEVSLPDEPVHLRADAVRLSQILENLLHNACKYTPDGGTIRVEVEPGAREAAIRVIDDGIGIEPAKQSRLFELFHQIDATLDRSQGGLGIGLALVRRLVDLHHGRVGVRSEGRGRGSTFEVVLPRAATADAPA